MKRVVFIETVDLWPWAVIMVGETGAVVDADPEHGDLTVRLDKLHQNLCDRYNEICLTDQYLSCASPLQAAMA